MSLSVEPKPRKIFSKSDVLNSKSRAIKYEKVEAWGGDVWIRSLSAKELLDWSENYPNDDKTKDRTRGNFLIAISLCEGEGGNPLFDADNKEEVEQAMAAIELKDMESNIRLSGQIRTLNKLITAKGDGPK